MLGEDCGESTAAVEGHPFAENIMVCQSNGPSQASQKKLG